MFYNTIAEEGRTLGESRAKALTQERMVIEIFRKNPDQKYTPFEIHRILGTGAPLTSIRRAITDLTAKGLIEKTSEMYRGGYGKPNFLWTLKKNKTASWPCDFTAVPLFAGNP